MKRIFSYLMLLLVLLFAPLAVNAQDNGGSRKPGTTAPKPKPNRKPTPKPVPKPKPNPTPQSKPQPVSTPKQVPSVNTAPIANQTFTVNGVSFTMIDVQGGTFTMGATAEQGSEADNDEKPTHKVTLSNFSIGQTEVTQALWLAVMGNNPSHFTSNLQRPVENVSWDDCQRFITKLNQLTGQNFRLPTEAEWEYAARGGSKSRGYKYAGGNAIGDVAWYYGNSGSTTRSVATKAPNELGLYDMSGNVCEWCQDWYGSYSSATQKNPAGPTFGSFQVNRGGCWYKGSGGCRVSDRVGNIRTGKNYIIGLRIAQ